MFFLAVCYIKLVWKSKLGNRLATNSFAYFNFVNLVFFRLMWKLNLVLVFSLFNNFAYEV